jgi:tetratricopeptide (TPR) repeat protein
MDEGGFPGYGLGVKYLMWTAIVCTACLPLWSAETHEFELALERARQAGLQHHYQMVIEILTPFNAIDDAEARYITAAEIGRAYFHLGRYHEAHQAFRQAVRLRPERPETAIYLEATSYLVGDTEQAYTILREILKSGARDLYLAVTLPGEKRFLADPKVHEITEQFAVPLEIDVESGRVHGVGLGESRAIAIEKLEASSSDPNSSALTASAGPAVIWAFVFDDQHNLEKIIVQAEHVFRYTPYRLRFDQGLDWKLTPAAAIAAWGPPVRTEPSGDDGMAVSWQFESHRLDLHFGKPRRPRPPGIADGVAFLRTIQLTRQSAVSADRMIE